MFMEGLAASALQPTLLFYNLASSKRAYHIGDMVVFLHTDVSAVVDLNGR